MIYSEILRECKRLARLSYADYGDISSYRQDYYSISKDRKAIKKRFGFISPDRKITVKYNRIEITETELDYTPGQYAPTEIYSALYRALEQFYK